MGKIKLLLSATVLLAFVGAGANYVVKQNNSLKLNAIKVKSLSTELDQLNLRYNTLDKQLKDANQEKNVNKQKVNDLNKQKQQLEEEKQRLEEQLQAKADAKTKLAQASTKVVNAATGTSTAYASSGIDCNNQTTAKAFIYCHESGNVADKWNGSGCYGLGQDCNNIVYNKCGADYACQDEFFTDYMKRRYGTWEAAKAHWEARVPINGRDVGNWW